MDAERREIVRQALARLGTPNREAVSLFYVDGLSYADIAGYLGVTEATVLGRLQRGRAELKKELLVMVEDAFKKEQLPEDFAARIRQLLETAAAHGQEREKSIQLLAEMGAPAVDPLCAALGDARPMVRRMAARALCQIGDARAAGPIFRALYAGDYWLYNTVFRTGGILQIPGVRDELLRIVKDGSRADRYWSIQALGHAKDDPEVWDVLSRIFRERDEDVGIRMDALMALWSLRPDRCPDLILEALRDPTMQPRGPWWWAWKHGVNVPLDLCLSGLSRDVWYRCRFEAALLALRHGEAGLAALENVLRTGSPDERAAAALGVATRKHPEAFDVLVNELLIGYRERKWARRIAGSLVRHYPERLIAWAREDAPDLSNHPELAWAVAEARLAAGETALADLVREGPPSARAHALRQLAEAQGSEILPELRRLLAAGMPGKVAREAFNQMDRLRDTAEPIVMEMLESDLWTERKAAYALLRRWHKLTPEQQAKGRSDPHPAVRHAADWPASIRQCADWHPKHHKRVHGDY